MPGALCHGVMEKHVMSSTLGVPGSGPEETTVRRKIRQLGGSRCADS